MGILDPLRGGGEAPVATPPGAGSGPSWRGASQPRRSGARPPSAGHGDGRALPVAGVGEGKSWSP
jgi:hypothetical protein